MAAQQALRPIQGQTLLFTRYRFQKDGSCWRSSHVKHGGGSCYWSAIPTPRRKLSLPSALGKPHLLNCSFLHKDSFRSSKRPSICRAAAASSSGPAWEGDVADRQVVAGSSSAVVALHKGGGGPERGRRRGGRGPRLRARLWLLLLAWRGLNIRIHRAWRSVGGFRRFLALLLMAFALGSALAFRMPQQAPPPKPVMYSTFLEHVEAGTVRTVLFQEGTQKLFFDLKEQERPPLVEKIATEQPSTSEVVLPAPSAHPSQYVTRRIAGEGSVLPLLKDHGVNFMSAPQPASATARSWLSYLVALWVPLVPLYLFFQRMTGGRDSKARKTRKGPSVTFKDVAGVDNAKTELMEVVRFLRSPESFTAVGAKLPRGVLLMGPPGTGKTLLAKAVAGEAGLPFFAASASEFVEMFVGRGALRVRELFREARKRAPCVVFIDELDAVGGKRGLSTNDERDQTLNQLLTEMDGFDSDGTVLVLAATNRAEMLDPALCRPGRFDRRVIVGPPDQAGREAILAIHTRAMAFAEDPNFVRGAVAAATPGFVGAELANLANEAVLLALREGRRQVQLPDFMQAIERALYGVGQRKDGGTVQRRLAKWLSGLGKADRKDKEVDNNGATGSAIMRSATLM